MQSTDVWWRIQLRRRQGRTLAMVTSLLAASACGGGDSPKTVVEPPPTTTNVVLAIVDGDRQQAPTGGAVPVSPVVEVRTAAGQVVANVPLTCSIAAGNGSVAASSATTDASGRASCGQWTLGAVGEQRLQVSPSGTTYVASSPLVVRATSVAAGGVSIGPPRTTTIASTTAISVTDTVTGLRFDFPQGGQGTLEIARVQPLAAEPAEGLTRFAAAFSGTQQVEVAVPLRGGELAAYFYGEMSGVATSGPGGVRWWALPVVRVRNDTGFAVLAASAASASSALHALFARDATFSSVASATAAPRVVQVYATAVLPPTSPTASVRRNYRLSVEQLIDWWKTNLSPAPSVRLAAAIAADPWNFSVGSSGTAYYAKGWFTTYNMPWLYYNTNKEIVVSARHEGTHYISHMLLGDARYREIEAFVPDDGHDLGRVAKGFRNSIIEEYPHLANFLMSGALDGHDLRSVSPVNNFRQLMANQPSKVDYPSLEGFGAAMLAALTRAGSDTLVYDFHYAGSQTRSPALGASTRQLLDVLAAGPRNPNELREALVPVAGSEATLAALLEPLGWSYQAWGRVVNELGVPIPDAIVASVVTATNGKSYRTVGSSPSGTTGRFWLPRMYPGTSTLRVYTSKAGGGIDSADVGTATAPWTQSTTDSVDLKDLVLPRLNAYTGIYVKLDGLTSPNTAGTDACRPNFSVIEILASDPSNTRTFPLTWNGLSFSTTGATSYDVPPAYSGAHLRRYEQQMSASGTLLPGRADTMWVTLTATSSNKELDYLVDAQTRVGRWVTSVNTQASISLRAFPVTLRSGSTPSMRGALAGSAASSALGAGWSASHYWVSPDLPTFHPQNCAQYVLGANPSVEVTILQR